MSLQTRFMGALLILGLGAAASARADYRPEGTCDGLPAITSLKVAPQFCLALAASRLGMPRGVLALSNRRLLVADMGSWDPRRGRLLELVRDKDDGAFRVQVLLKGLNRPHGLRQDAEGRILLGESDRISWLELPANGQTAKLHPIITELPADGRHPLKTFAVGPKGELFLNLGAPTDHCEPSSSAEKKPATACNEGTGPQARAAVWKYERVGPSPERWEGHPFALGLRNSMGLAVHPESRQLWQAENSRDTLPGDVYSKTQPPDELNALAEGKHYGWPHCTGTDVFDKRFGAKSCADFTSPIKLIPAHAAPLGMLFYTARQAPPEWRGALVMAWHGYQSTGHRLMAWRFDSKHQPQGNAAPLISGWNMQANRHPLGAPVEVTQDESGRLWITEDRNGTLLVLVPKKEAH